MTNEKNSDIETVGELKPISVPDRSVSYSLRGTGEFESSIISCLDEGSRIACESYVSGEITVTQLDLANAHLARMNHAARYFLQLLQHGTLEIARQRLNNQDLMIETE